MPDISLRRCRRLLSLQMMPPPPFADGLCFFIRFAADDAITPMISPMLPLLIDASMPSHLPHLR